MYIHQSTMPLPQKGEEVPLPRIQEICEHFGLQELWDKIAKDPPPQPFRSDGCSLWFDTWQGVDLYPACFLHDLKYWAGYPGEDVARLIADAELMIDVAAWFKTLSWPKLCSVESGSVATRSSSAPSPGDSAVSQPCHEFTPAIRTSLW